MQRIEKDKIGTRISTIQGEAIYQYTDVEDINGKWDDVTPTTKNGFYVIHYTDSHDVYKVKEAGNFLGSRADGETEIEHAEREAQWKEDHACSLCESFECDGSCEDEGSHWDDMDMETQGFDVPDKLGGDF